MIREATEQDLEAIMEMAEKFYAATEYSEVIPFDRESAENLVLSSCKQGMCFVDDDYRGFVLGMLFPYSLNNSEIVGSELAWWVEPEYRNEMVGIQLLEALESAAETNGAKMWSMMCLESIEPDKVERIYERMGYTRTERTFTRTF